MNKIVDKLARTIGLTWAKQASYLRELFYDRNPGDARVKVGSERKFASSPARTKFRC